MGQDRSDLYCSSRSSPARTWCPAFSRTDDSRSSAVVTLAVPDRSNATPSIASDGAFVAVAWGASLASGATDIVLATSRDGGRTFGAPVRVNDKDGDARVNGEQPPRVVVQHADPPVVTVVWTTKGEKRHGSSSTRGPTTAASRSRTRRRFPGGARPATAVGRLSQSTALLSMSSGSITASSPRRIHRRSRWRRCTISSAGAKPDGVAMAQKSKLYIAAIDGSTAPQAITGGVCYCCKTALADRRRRRRSSRPGVTSIPATSATLRSRSRATADARSRAPVRVSEDKWELEGCSRRWAGDGDRRAEPDPHRVADAGQATRPADTIALFYASSSDGRTFHRARADSDRGNAAPSADRDLPGRLAGAGVLGRAGGRHAPRRVRAD